MLNSCHAVGDGDGCQAATIIESIVANARHAVGDGDGGQAAAATESQTSNIRYAVGDNQILNLYSI